MYKVLYIGFLTFQLISVFCNLKSSKKDILEAHNSRKFNIIGIAYIYQKATRKLFIKEFEYEIYEDFFYIDGNKYEYQDVIKCEIHYFDYFFINVLCLHIDMKNTSKSTILLYSEDLDEGIDCKDIQLFKFYESVSKHLRIS